MGVGHHGIGVGGGAGLNHAGIGAGADPLHASAGGSVGIPNLPNIPDVNTSGTSSDPSINSDPNPIPAPQPLLNGDGPKTGAVPIMPNGSCPKEFPNKRGNACFDP